MRKILAAILVVAGFGLLVFGSSPFVTAATSGDVTVTFNILSTQELTINRATVQFNDVQPGITAGPIDVTVTVKSNTSYDLDYTASNFASGASTIAVDRLSYNGTAFAATAKLVDDAAATGNTGATYEYAYTLAVEWTDPVAASYTGTVTYAATPGGL